MFKQYLREPMWFKLLIATALLISIIFSSSAFSSGYYQSLSKLAAAIFFLTYGIRMRRNTRVAAIFFVVAGVCMYLAWDSYMDI